MSEAKYWIALDMVKGIGPANLQVLYEKISFAKLSVRDVFELTEKEITFEFGVSDKIAAAIGEAKKYVARAEEICMQLQDAKVEIILFFEKKYPSRLHHVLKHAAPPMLFAFGNTALFLEKGAAILGDMRVSEKGALIASLAAKELVMRKILVISGLAQGVDTIAHASALQHGGCTIAMLPFGMFHFKMPKSLEIFYDENRMLCVSHFYPDREYSIYNSYERNKIIVALSRAVFIVESPSEGGVFEAAKSAQNLKIPLFVAQYASYPPSASGNEKIISEFSAIPIKGRREGELIVPNMDKLIAKVKFSE
ncbi:MAG: DNA-protecting protein DprA [Spirochaetes bacterium]|nr:DNA-protecting protein DprA [Spirochaetota bacterium]